MDVEPVAAGPVLPTQAKRSVKTESSQKRQLEDVEPVISDADSSVRPDKEPGVLRLLKQGHFNPVADLRHRIKYAEELAALDADEMKSLAPEQTDRVVDAVVTALDGLAVPTEPTEDPLAEPTEESSAETDGQQTVPSLPDTLTEPGQQFTDMVGRVRDDFLNADSPSVDTLVNGLNEAFDAIVDSLTQALQPAVEPSQDPADAPQEPETVDEGQQADSSPDVEPAEPDPQSETSTQTEPQVDITEIVQNLRTVYEEALAGLVDSLDGVSILPEPAAPHGNGVAYEKFLAIYNGMNDPISNEESVDSIS